MGICCSCSRELVSKKKIRTKTEKEGESPKGGVNLDLTLIHPRIICMGLPAVGIESWYRNPYDEVKSYLDFKFGSKYWVYNLCSEEGHHYGPERFDGRVANFPFPDHHASPLEFIPKFIAHATDFISKDPQNVVAIHCKAGKGRTGLFACCLLMALEPATLGKPEEAITFYGRQRTSNGRGLTIPSQIRYVGYYAQLVEKFGGKVPAAVPKIDFLTITFRGLKETLNFDNFSFEFSNGEKITIPASIKDAEGDPEIRSPLVIEKTERDVVFHVSKLPKFQQVQGDVRINLNVGKTWKAALTFHTLFLERSYPLAAIDKLYKKEEEGVTQPGDGIYFDYMECMQPVAN